MDNCFKQDLNIAQLNIHSIRPIHKRETIKTYLKTKNIHIFLIQETWLKPDEKYKFLNYKFAKNCRPDGYGGTGILIHPTLIYEDINLTDIDLELTAIKIKNTKQPIIFISTYIPPDTPISEIKEPLEKLFHFISNSNTPVFLGGDLNAHHPTWDNVSKRTDGRGELISELIDNNNVVILNTGVATRWEDLNCNPSAIDLTFTTPDIAPHIHWDTSTEDLGSDHKLIECHITSYNKFNNISARTIISKQKAIQNLNQINPNSITNAENLNEKINNALNNATYTIFSNSKKQIKPYWNDNIKKLYEIKNKKHIEFRNNLSLENKHEFKKAERNFKKALKNEVFNYRNKMIEEINEQTSVNQMWKIVRCISGNFKNKDNTEITNNKELATKFIDLNFKEINNIEPIVHTNFDVTEEKYLAPLNIKQMIEKIRQKKDSSAAGQNKLSYFHLKNINTNLLIKILEITNKVWKDEIIPEEWLLVKIIPILKPGKDKLKESSYRPIALINVNLKIINNEVKQRLNLFIEQHELLPSLSYGFRAGYSAINCVNHITSIITEAKRQKQKVATIFLDLTKAFDSVDVNILLKKLDNIKTPNKIISWLELYLKNRKIIMQTSQGDFTQNTNKGLPQGCPLSPTLFNIYTKDLHEITTDKVILVQFADDFSITIIGDSLEEIEMTSNIILRKISEQLTTLKININPDKSAVILFNSKTNDKINIQINNIQIEQKEQHKYLGYILDEKLSHKAHINHVNNKVKKRLNVLKMICKKNKGAHPKTALKINKAIIRSQIDYGLTLYGGTAKSNLLKLNSSFNTSLRTCLRLLKSTPINVLYSEAGEIPIYIRAKWLAKKEVINTFANNKPITQIVSKFLEINNLPKHYTFLELIIFENNYLIVLTSNSTKQKENITINLKNMITEEITDINTTNMNNKTIKYITSHYIKEHYSDFTKIYTDGSKTSEACGIGIWCEENNEKIKCQVNKAMSIMNVELMAINIAIDVIETKEKEKFVICSDSKSALSSIKNENSKDNFIIYNIINKLNKTNKTIKLQWVPGHKGITGNENADILSKEGCTSEQIIHTRIPLNDTLNLAKTEALQDWIQEYTSISTEKGTKHYNLMKTPTFKPWFEKLELNTQQIVTIGRLRSFHTATKDKLYIWKLIQDDKCDQCGVKEDSNHILLICPKYAQSRAKYKILTLHNNIETLLSQAATKDYEEISEFVKINNITI